MRHQHDPTMRQTFVITRKRSTCVEDATSLSVDEGTHGLAGGKKPYPQGSSRGSRCHKSYEAVTSNSTTHLAFVQLHHPTSHGSRIIGFSLPQTSRITKITLRAPTTLVCLDPMTPDTEVSRARVHGRRHTIFNTKTAETSHLLRLRLLSFFFSPPLPSLSLSLSRSVLLLSLPSLSSLSPGLRSDLPPDLKPAPQTHWTRASCLRKQIGNDAEHKRKINNNVALNKRP